jgi:hypothetical protein
LLLLAQKIFKLGEDYLRMTSLNLKQCDLSNPGLLNL